MPISSHHFILSVVALRKFGKELLASWVIHFKKLKAMQTNILGYPRIGSRRELKKACESFWAGNITENDLLRTGAVFPSTCDGKRR